MLTAPADDVRARAARAAATLGAANVACDVIASEATVGGGAFPAARIPSFAVRLDAMSPETADARLLAGRVPVVGRTVDGHLTLDLRSVPDAHDDLLATAVREALA
ncbi:MAG TPA: hypothetical protein VG916_05020, partial [Gemmatimonadaceae bacterium]|nr:hypothetical protein [Gemmatimonadaceae bacterium]